MSLKRQREIVDRLMEIDNILHEAANEYSRKTRGVAEEKVALIKERMALQQDESV